jgi:hypothetical protein
METREDILKELSEIAPALAALDKTNPFKLPEGYFNNFSTGVLNRIKFGEVKAELNAVAPELAGLTKPLTIQEPASYFSGLPGKVMHKIRGFEVAQELAEIAPALSKLEKINSVEVPAGYFSMLPQQLLNKVQQQRPVSETIAPGIITSLDNLFERWISVIFRPKYTVAFAGLATTLIIAVMMFTKVQQRDDLDSRFAQLSTDEINNYLENRSDAYSDEVFEMNIGQNMTQSDISETTLHVYKDALKDVDDASLNEAIEN